MKKFSVIIPAKNEAKYLKQCLGSLAVLDYPVEQYEVIIADNGSKDNTRKIAQSYSAQVVNASEQTTIAAVRNAGAKNASGEVFVFLDADCTVARDWLQKAERYISREDIACFGSPPIIPQEASWVENTWYLARKSYQQVYERQWQESTNMFIPKSLFNRVGGFNKNLVTCEDVDLSYRLLDLGKIVSDESIVAVHHRDPKTVKEFFFKERWRGKSNYAGLLQHGVKLQELPSLMLPLYFTCLLFVSIISFFFSLKMAGLFFLAAEIPVIGLTCFKLRRSFRLRSLLGLLFLYNVYFLARASAILNIKSPLR